MDAQQLTSSINNSINSTYNVLERSLSQAAEIQLCRQDFWEFAARLKTLDPENNRVRPFPVDYEFLHNYHDRIVTNRKQSKTITHKAVRMMVTNYHSALRLWRAWRTGKDESYQGCIISQGEREAKDVITDRMRFMYGTLPEHLQQFNKASISRSQGMPAIKFELGGRVVAFPATENPGRSFGFTDAFCDEMAFWPYARNMWAAIAPRAKQIDVVSTPNGPYNMFHSLWTKQSKYKLDRISLLTDQHPDRKIGTPAGDAYHSECMATMDAQQYAREILGSFTMMAGKPVYGRFSETVHASMPIHVPIGANTVICEGYDFGYNHPAVVWAWINDDNQLCIIREYMPEEVSTKDLGQGVLDIRDAAYRGCIFREFGDVAGHHKSSTADNTATDTDIKVLRKLGINVRAKRRNIRDGIELIRNLLKIRADGKPGLLVDPSCRTVIDAFNGGYHYPDKEAGPNENPEKDGFYDNPMDALRYLAHFVTQDWMTVEQENIRKRQQQDPPYYTSGMADEDEDW